MVVQKLGLSPSDSATSSQLQAAQFESRLDHFVQMFAEYKRQVEERFSALLAVNDDLTTRVESLESANREMQLKLSSVQLDGPGLLALAWNRLTLF